IAGYDVRAALDRIKPILGYMPQSFSLYPDLSVEENLAFYAGLFGITGASLAAKTKRLYEFSGLFPFSRRRAGALSGGMKQKLALSCALVHDPKVLILDEPTTGVDPLSRRQFWEILFSLKNSGSAILVSTPYMDEVSLADRAVLVHQGKKLAEGTPADIARRFRGSLFRLKREPTVDVMKRAGAIEGVSARRFGSSVHLYGPSGCTADRLSRDLERAGIGGEVEPLEPELEDVFVQMMEG
ncbi:MAG: transporter-related protein, partial [Candidatus Krumholzibacteriota bacterium]|nr:transporter-related protein [Candidatus Krumholzibacteriota bacterium]